MADETNADYENTINQFRELVANLQRYNPKEYSLIYIKLIYVVAN